MIAGTWQLEAVPWTAVFDNFQISPCEVGSWGNVCDVDDDDDGYDDSDELANGTLPGDPLSVPADADEKALETAALAEQRVVEAIAGKTVRKVVVVKGRLVNIVAT